MAKLQFVRAASGNPLLRVFIQDSSSTTGAGKTGLSSSSSGLTVNVMRELDSTVTVYAQASSNLETITTLGTYAAPTASKARIKEIDATNLPGWYEIHLAQALTGTGDASRFLSGSIFGATNVAPCPFELQLTAWNSEDAVRGGLTALPNANAEASGGLYTRGTGAGQINQPSNGRVDTNPVSLAGTTLTGRDIGASVLLSSGTGTGQLDFTSGVVRSNLAQILGTALTETAGLLAGGFKKFFNVASPTLTCLGIDQTGDSYARIGAPVGASISADVAGVQSDTDNIQTRIPAALVSGRIDASVGAMAANVVTAAAIADAAIDRATFAADTGLQSVRSNTAAAGAAGTITLDASASAVDDFYRGALIRLTGGTGAGQTRLILSYVGSTQVATISPNWATNPDNTSTFAILSMGRVSVGAYLESVVSALISGRVDASVGAYQSGLTPLQPTTAGRTLDVSTGGEAGLDWANIGSPTTTVGLSGTTIKEVTDVETKLGSPAGASVSADIAAIQSDTDNIQTRLPAALVSGRMDSSVGAMAANTVTASAVASGAIDRDALATDTGLQSVRSNTAAAGAAGSITLDASASSVDDFYRGAFIYLTGGTGAGQTRLILSYVGSTQVATISPNWATNPDNTSTFAIRPFGRVSVGAYLESVVNALISGRVDASVGAYQSGLTPLQPTVSGRTLDVSAGGEAGLDWANIGSPTTTVGLSGTTIKEVTDVETKLGSPAGASVSADIAAIQSDTDNIQTRLPAALVSGRMDASVGAMATNVLTSGALDAGAASEIAGAVWDETLASHLTSGSTGAALNAAGAAGDPWSTALPGAYGVGTAGKIVGDNINATISSRLAPTTAGRTLDVTATGEAGIDWANIGTPTTSVNLSGTTIKEVTDVETKLGSPAGASIAADLAEIEAETDDIAAIKAKTDKLPASPAAVGDIPTATENADALLKRDMSAVTGESSRSPLNAFRFIRNKWGVSGSALTVTKEDDTTTAWTAIVSTDASADPITGSDPA